MLFPAQVPCTAQLRQFRVDRERLLGLSQAILESLELRIHGPRFLRFGQFLGFGREILVHRLEIVCDPLELFITALVPGER